MTKGQKILIAVIVLLAIGAVIYFLTKNKKKEEGPQIDIVEATKEEETTTIKPEDLRDQEIKNTGAVTTTLQTTNRF